MSHRTDRRGALSLTLSVIVFLAPEVIPWGPGSLGPPDRARSAWSAQAQSPAPAPSSSLAQVSLEDLQRRIAASSGKSRKELLQELDRGVRELTLTNDQIDVVIAQLQSIEKDDPYEEPKWFKVRERTKENARMVFVNRQLATRLIEELRYRKITNGLAALPLEERVKALMQYFEGSNSGGSTNWFSGELYRSGSDAVPLIIERMQASAEFDLIYSQLLSQIGDPHGVEAIALALGRTATNDRSRLCDLIHTMKAFEWSFDQWKRKSAASPQTTAVFTIDWRKSAATALIETLRSEVRQVADANMPQQQPTMGHVRLPFRHYPVRQCAAEALSGITGKNWGMLFNEDFATWHAWSSNGAGPNFEPADLPRTDQELALLIENFTYRCMQSYVRTYNWHDRDLREYSPLRDDIDRLGKLSPRAVVMLVDSYRSISTEFPVWGEDLKRWTILLLRAMDTPDAREAASKLST